ncbi:MAG TPA: energy transducer TonB [Pyrinomonadaceae bacterium]|jgi:protein TonB
MFHNLIESGSHRRDLARRGRFFLGTLASYALVAAFAGVAGVYAYSAHLDEQNYQITMLPPLAVPRATAPEETPERATAPRRAGATNEAAMRTKLYTDLNTPPRTPPPVSNERNDVPPVVRGIPTVIGDHNFTPTGPVGPKDGLAYGGASAQPTVRVPVNEIEDPRPPEPAAPAPAPKPRTPVVISQILTSKIVSKPVPPYPPLARAARQQGTVTVEILVDEQGRVVRAAATSGPPMLREAARQAAMLARFTQTKLNGEPVKVSGVITYNFVLN